MKQIAWIYVVLAGLAVAFGIVCIAIFIFGPRSSLVSKKLRFGAMIITFNTMLAGCYAARDVKESVTCYTDSDSNTDSDTKNTGDSETEKDTATQPRDTDVTCYEMVLDSGMRDTGTADTEWPTDVECYVDISTDTDTTPPTFDTDTGEPSTDSDTGRCYEPYNETDIECYDIAEDHPTDADTPSNDAGASDTDTYDTEPECYVIIL